MKTLPVIPKLPDEVKRQLDRPNEELLNPVTAICGECGLRLHQVMGYACSNRYCPCGFGPTT